MHPTKAKLITNYGLRCMACGKEVPIWYIQYHHIVPRYITRMQHKPDDDSYENGSLLCKRCHAEIHKFWWQQDEYQVMISMIENYKEQHKED